MVPRACSALAAGPGNMRPIDVTVTDLGIVIGTYEPASPVRHGQM
jgi:hypothetical protein